MLFIEKMKETIKPLQIFTVIGHYDGILGTTVDWVTAISAQDAADEIGNQKDGVWFLIAIFRGFQEDITDQLDEGE